uniref:Uncharacterized protein n=1 Tax=Corethron hystrix TaxID=216773 RepID=A0A6U5JCY3_9STRA|mmetsp:Transcript_362/g.771  ORF Transcript_362/g.771 Transcript_362/m.771 type:complete len:249 (+) Transcript_362:257-1003(+)
MAASVVHLLPDATENQRLATLGCSAGDDGCENIFPWVYFFYGVGFLMILCLESLAHACARNNIHERDPVPAEETSDEEDSAAGFSYRSMDRDHDRVDGTDSGVLALVIFLSLSSHSVMEGVAIGSQNDAALDIFLAVVAHKMLAAFALGLELMSQGLSTRRFVGSIFLFSIMSPIGIFLGWLSMGGAGSEETLASGIFTALSGGTFLFVAVMEIIPKELQELRSHNQILKLFVLCASFVAFSLLAIWV